jgi:hypothetical protein
MRVPVRVTGARLRHTTVPGMRVNKGQETRVFARSAGKNERHHRWRPPPGGPRGAFQPLCAIGAAASQVTGSSGSRLPWTDCRIRDKTRHGAESGDPDLAGEKTGMSDWRWNADTDPGNKKGSHREPFEFRLIAGSGGEHVLHGSKRLLLDLADAFRRYAVFLGEIVQGRLVLFRQPAPCDDVAAAVVEFRQGGL